MKDSIHNITNEEDLKNKTKNLYSIYPIIYWKINNNNNIKFIPDLNINKLFKKSITVEIANQILIEKISSLYNSSFIGFPNILRSTQEFNNKEFNKEFLNLMKDSLKFFILANYKIKDLFYDYRKRSLKDCYNITYKNGEIDFKTIRAIQNRHDAFMGNYLGKLVDEKGFKYLDSIINKIKLKDLKYEKNLIDKDKNNGKNMLFDIYFGIHCNYMYRLIEINKIFEARSFAKKTIKKIKLYGFISNFFNFPLYLNNFERIKFGIKVYNFIVGRRLTNLLIPLYRSYKNKNKFLYKYYLKKCFKFNNIGKMISSENHYGYIHSLKKNSVGLRTQHVLKTIEIYVDYYCDIKKDKKVLAQIHFLIQHAMRIITFTDQITENNIPKIGVSYEFFLTVAYYLEKIHKINIRNF